MGKYKISFAEKCPELVKYWAPENILRPETTGASATKHKIVFICDEGHRWPARLDHISNGHWCPFCANQKVSPTNNLAFVHPELAKQWDYNENDGLTPDQVLAGSGHKYSWKCPKGDDHIWIATIYSRVCGNGCPCCSNQKVCSTNNLEYVYPELAKQWYYEKNYGIKPNQIVAGTPKKFWWICSEGHIWEASPDARITNGTGCPDCPLKSQAYTKEILLELGFIPEKIRIPLPVFLDGKQVRKTVCPDFSISIGKKTIYIEYNGEQHFWPVDFGNGKEKANQVFLEQQARDQTLRKDCQEKGIHLIEIDGRQFNEKSEIEQFLKPLLNELLSQV